MNTACTCGRITVSHSDNVAMHDITCGPECAEVQRLAVIGEWLKTQPWFVRLDEWQHRHAPKWPHGERSSCDHRHPLATCWWLMWRPLCDYTERYQCGAASA